MVELALPFVNPTPATCDDSQALCAQYLDEFGELGGQWFAQGIGLSEARSRFGEMLQEENAAMRERLSK
ncbi:MAG: hypothetical protein AAGJ46_13450 [Planctomycetota bacterium]